MSATKASGFFPLTTKWNLWNKCLLDYATCFFILEIYDCKLHWTGDFFFTKNLIYKFCQYLMISLHSKYRDLSFGVWSLFLLVTRRRFEIYTHLDACCDLGCVQMLCIYHLRFMKYPMPSTDFWFESDQTFYWPHMKGIPVSLWKKAEDRRKYVDVSLSHPIDNRNSYEIEYFFQTGIRQRKFEYSNET